MFAHRHLRSTAIAVATVLLVSLGTPAFATTTPARATGLKSSVTSSSATLSWSGAANAKLYSVCLMTSGSTSKCYRTSFKRSARSVTFFKLKPTGGTDYYWRVKAYNGSKTSSSAKAKFNLATKPAPASSTKPATPTGIKNVVSTSGVNVTWAAARNAKTYRVCLLSSSISSTCKRLSAPSATTSAAFDNLAPTGNTDWYVRVHAYNGSAFTLSARVPFDLPVAKVSGLQVGDVETNSVGVDWDAVPNAGAYEVQYANSPGMTINFRTLTMAGTSRHLTGLTPGKTYYMKVRGLNDNVAGALASAPAQRLPTDPFATTVVTYNLCGQDKCLTATNMMKTWPTRKTIAGAIVRRTESDIIAAQEATSKDTNFITQLGGKFTLGAYYSAKSLYYRTAKFTKLRSGTITLDSTSKKYAVWVELQDKATMTRFIVSDAHTVSGKGATLDAKRRTQTERLLAGVAKANPQKLPVVHAGDFNSNKNNATFENGYDAPLQVMTAAGIDDSFETSSTTSPYRTWNSCNQAKVYPRKNSDHIDHIFVDPRIAVTSWQVITYIVDATHYKTPFASDHNPVMATLTIPGSS